MKLYDYQAGWYFFVNDHLGTPQKIVNESGQVVWAGFYQPFGKAWAYPADITNNFRFPGQYYDAETGLNYNWHRYYDPETGRYITADPIGLEGGVNLYVYVMNNPVIFADPNALVLVSFSMESANAIAELIKNSPAAGNIIRKLNNSSEIVAIFTTAEEHLVNDFCWGKNQYDREKKAVVFDPVSDYIYDGSEKWMHRPSEIGLAHELAHALQHIEGREGAEEGLDGAIDVENQIRDDYRKHGDDIDLSPENYQMPGGGFNF